VTKLDGHGIMNGRPSVPAVRGTDGRAGQYGGTSARSSWALSAAGSDHEEPSAGFPPEADNQIMRATQTYELCPRMAWQYHGYGVQDTLHENWFLSVVLPRHPWACLLLSFLKRIEGRNRLVAGSTNQDASTGSQRRCASAPKKSSRDAEKKLLLRPQPNYEGHPKIRIMPTDGVAILRIRRDGGSA